MKTVRWIAILGLVASALAAQGVDWGDRSSVAAAAVAASSPVRALEADLEAARARAEGAGALPNPMAMGGVQNLNIDLSNDEMMTMYMVGASQTFTPGRQRRADEAAAEARVTALEGRRRSLEAEIARDAEVTWLQLASIDERIGVVERVLALIESTIAAARARYESGSVIQAEVIRAQLAQSDLTHRLIALRGERRAREATLRAVLDLPADTAIPRLHLTHAHAVEPPPAVLPGDHAAVAALLAEVATAEAAIARGESARRPEWGVEASYGFRPEQMDMITVVATVELPIRKKNIEPAIREAVAAKNAALERVESLRRSLREQAGIAAAVLGEANEQLRFHEEVLVPQSQLAFDSTLAAYQSARADMNALLATQTAYVELASDSWEFLARALSARADLEALAAGATTIRTGAGSIAAPSSSTTASSGSASSMGSM